MNRIREAFDKVVKKLGKVSNYAILSVLYIFLIGFTYLFVRMAGIKALEMDSKTSTWSKPDNAGHTFKTLTRQW
jgi:hypothetical protein